MLFAEPAVMHQTKSVYQFQGVIGTKDLESLDLDAHLIWRYYGYQYSREDLENDPEASSPDIGA